MSNRRNVFAGFWCVASLLLASGSTAQLTDKPAPAAGAFEGPIAQLVPKGVRAGLPTSGLGFDVVINAADKAVSPASVELKKVTWWGGLNADIAGAKFDDATHTLTFSIRFTNTTGSPALGLRLDLSGAAEEYKARNDKNELSLDGDGKPVIRLRPLKDPDAPPIAIGDLADKQASEIYEVSVPALTMGADATRVLVRFGLSGLLFQRAISDAAIRPFRVDSDFEGKLYFADSATNKVFQYDGKAFAPFAEFAGQGPVAGMSINRYNREMLVSRIGDDGLGRADFAGKPMDRIKLMDGDQAWSGGVVRSDKDGTIFVLGNGKLHEFGPAGQSKRQMVLDIPGVNARTPFDVDKDGVVWVLAPQGLYRVEPGQSSAEAIANVSIPGGGMTGLVLENPKLIRTDKPGNLFVVEAPAGGLRLKVLDKIGRPVRWCSFAPGLPVEQAPTDMAFTPDGRMYIATPAHGPGGNAVVLVYQPF